MSGWREHSGIGRKEKWQDNWVIDDKKKAGLLYGAKKLFQNYFYYLRLIFKMFLIKNLEK